MCILWIVRVQKDSIQILFTHLHQSERLRYFSQFDVAYRQFYAVCCAQIVIGKIVHLINIQFVIGSGSTPCITCIHFQSVATDGCSLLCVVFAYFFVEGKIFFLYYNVFYYIAVYSLSHYCVVYVVPRHRQCPLERANCRPLGWSSSLSSLVPVKKRVPSAASIDLPPPPPLTNGRLVYFPENYTANAINEINAGVWKKNKRTRKKKRPRGPAAFNHPFLCKVRIFSNRRNENTIKRFILVTSQVYHIFLSYIRVLMLSDWTSLSICCLCISRMILLRKDVERRANSLNIVASLGNIRTYYWRLSYIRVFLHMATD